MKIKTKIRRREVNKKAKLPDNLPPLLNRLYASRGILKAEDLERRVRGMLTWKSLSGIELAVSIMHEAFYKKTKIVVVGDFDVDGATSTALTILSLRALGYNNVTYLVPSRFANNYGLSKEIIDQVHTVGAKMIITVDNGISSHTEVDYAHQLGITVIITDHHLPGKTLPLAEAIINPNLNSCNFPSKHLAGVGVAFYLMIAFRSFLYEKGWFKKNRINVPNLAKYLDLVAFGTIADMVPLDLNNRILTWQGLIRIRAGECRPGIKILLEKSNCDQKRLSTSDLSFILGPRINAAGRIDNMSIGIDLLLCEDLEKARILANRLNLLNQTRKEIEQKMQTEAFKLFEIIYKNEVKLPYGLVMHHSEWHQGVVGILASRIKEKFNRPVIAFAPAGDGKLKGSGRSVHGLHIRNILEQLNELHPNLMVKFGGHEMAVGLSLEKDKLDDFKFYFESLVTKFLNPKILQKEIISDGPLESKEMTIEVAQMLNNAGPWGQMFPEPIFDGHFCLLRQKLISNRHLKVTLKPIDSGPLLEGIIFNVDTNFWPNRRLHRVEITYKLDVNSFRGSHKLQIIINSIWPI